MVFKQNKLFLEDPYSRHFLESSSRSVYLNVVWVGVGPDRADGADGGGDDGGREESRPVIGQLV